MIKTNELRIGNWISDMANQIPTFVLRQVQVSSIDDKLINHIDIRNYEPIPLTEDVLLKAGFTRHHQDYSNGTIYIKNVVGNKSFIWGVYPSELGSGIVVNDSKPLEYLHQLQNLIFSITGEELTITL